MKNKKALALLALVGIMVGIFILLPSDLFTLETLKSKQTLIAQYHVDHPLLTPLIFVLVYITATALSLPGATILTLASGAIFGLFQGTVLASFASVVGATIAFLLARYFFRDAVKRKMGDKLEQIEASFEESGAFYLFSLRLVPVVPFFAINILMALTPIKTWLYATVSWVGMLAGTMVFVNAGTQLAGITSLKGILSPGIILSLVLLAVFPYIAQFLVSQFSSKTS